MNAIRIPRRMVKARYFTARHRRAETPLLLRSKAPGEQPYRVALGYVEEFCDLEHREKLWVFTILLGMEAGEP